MIVDGAGGGKNVYSYGGDGGEDGDDMVWVGPESKESGGVGELKYVHVLCTLPLGMTSLTLPGLGENTAVLLGRLGNSRPV